MHNSPSGSSSSSSQGISSSSSSSNNNSNQDHTAFTMSSFCEAGPYMHGALEYPILPASPPRRPPGVP